MVTFWGPRVVIKNRFDIMVKQSIFMAWSQYNFVEIESRVAKRKAKYAPSYQSSFDCDGMLQVMEYGFIGVHIPKLFDSGYHNRE